MNVATVRARLQEIDQNLTALEAEREALLAVKRGYEALLNLHRDDAVVPDEGRDHSTEMDVPGEPRQSVPPNSVASSDGQALARTIHGVGQRSSVMRTPSRPASPSTRVSAPPVSEPDASEPVVSASAPTTGGPITFRRAIAQVMRGAGDAPIASQVVLDRARELGGRTEAKKPLSAIDQTLKSLADRDDLPILQVGFRLWRWTGQVDRAERI